jgi:alkanesulfonate monooxygenase SsuD/methylene tetrahydromethanopterin reductase-like flavin-dependent oxidoreductase (luciferase family)
MPVPWMPPKDELVAANLPFYANGANAPYMTTVTFEQALADGFAYVGTPEQVADQIASLWGPLHVDELSVLAHFGGLEQWQVLKTQELFAREVVPLLKRRGVRATRDQG